MFILKALIVAVLIEIIAWLYYRKNKNPTIVDVAWPIAITLTSLTNYPNIPLINIIFLCSWCSRLAMFLYINRIVTGHIDPRYLHLKEQSELTEDIYFLKNFLIQGLLAFTISSIFIFSSKDSSTSIGLLAVTGYGLSIIGYIIETTADLQLAEHKKQSSELCKTKLWSISRHPNLLGEAIIWLGFSISMWPTNHYSFIGWIILVSIMNFITIPISEEVSLKRRGKEYERYQQSTSKWLWF